MVNKGKGSSERREDNRHRKWAWSKRRRDGDGESGSPVHRPLSPVTVSGGERREESRAAARHPQSNSIQGSPASACLPPTLHPITADTFPPTTLLLTASTYYFTHSHAHTHCECLCVHHTQADVWLVNNGDDKFRNKWCERCRVVWRCAVPLWGFHVLSFSCPVTLTHWLLARGFVTTDTRRMTMRVDLKKNKRKKQTFEHFGLIIIFLYK